MYERFAETRPLHVADLCSQMISLRIELYQITKHQHFKYSKEEPGKHQL